jgi:hypothetical protein
MSNNIFRAKALTVIRETLEEIKNAGQLNHPGLIGEAREIFVEKLLKPFLLPGVGFGTGKIVDWLGNQSDQTDIIIYHKNILPPILYSERDGVFPMESSLYTIEVKTEANSTNIVDTINKLKSLLKLQYNPHFVIDSHFENVNCFFATKSDLTSGPQNELERFRKLDENFETNPLVTVICIIGRGYWYINQDKKWVFVSASEDYNELIGFISGINNTLSMSVVSRLPAKLGFYLMDSTCGFEILEPKMKDMQTRVKD